MDVYLIRHGQSTNNALFGDTHLRVSDPHLTALGQHQAEHLATHFTEMTNPDEYRGLAESAPERTQAIPYKFTHLYCSPMRRTLQTIQPIAEALGIQPEIHPEVYEMGGVFMEQDGITTGYGGMSRSEIADEFPDVIIPECITEAGWYNAKQGKEPISVTMGRAIKIAYEMFVRGKNEDTLDESVAVVAHAGFIAFYMKALMNALPNFNYMLTFHNTSVTRITYTPDLPPRIMYMNRVSHLPSEMVT